HKRLNRQHEAWGHSWRAGCLILMDRCADALDSIGAALELLAPLNDNAKLVSYALRCNALLQLGQLEEAIDAADVTSSAVAKIPAIIWEKYRGLSAPAEVYLRAWERSNDAAVAEKLRRGRAAAPSRARVAPHAARVARHAAPVGHARDSRRQHEAGHEAAAEID